MSGCKVLSEDIASKRAGCWKLSERIGDFCIAETPAKPQLILMCVGEQMLLGCCSPRSRYHCEADLGVWRQKTLLLATLEV